MYGEGLDFFDISRLQLPIVKSMADGNDLDLSLPANTNKLIMMIPVRQVGLWGKIGEFHNFIKCLKNQHRLSLYHGVYAPWTYRLFKHRNQPRTKVQVYFPGP